MNIHLLSDLHNEFDYFLPGRAAAQADVVVLAGDIHLGVKGVEWAAKNFTAPVLYVPGNHEYYRGHLGKTLLKMIDSGDARVRVLDCDEWVLGGVRFLCATAWTDYSGAGDTRLALAEARATMSDFSKIRVGNDYRRLSPFDLIERNRYSRQWLAARLATPFDGATVVVTHHAPSLRSIYPDRARACAPQPIDASYANNWDALLGGEGVRLWLHGHTHLAVDYTVGATRVVSNPRGYPDERTGFDSELLIEIPSDA